jgi:hypothetical protein
MADDGNEADAALTITSAKLTAAQMMHKAGLEPDAFWDRGDPLSHSPSRTHTSNGISFASHISPSESADEHLRALVARLSPHSERLAKLGAEVEAEGGLGRRYALVVRVHTNDINADVEVHRDDLPVLARLGAWFAGHVWCTPAD